jgi:pyruvate ferredoxin oxidoreductase alpha subunit
MSVAIGASAAGARTYTATASQGLLFMVEAVYNASGLGLPIVMTVANRAIGAPINIWNDHTDSMSQRDCRLDPALRRDQPGGRRPAHPGLQDRRGTVDAGDGLHGRLHPHPRLRARSTCPTQEQVDRFLPPFEPRQVLDPATTRCRSARWSAPRPSWRCATSPTPSRCQALELIPEVAGGVQGRCSAATRAAWSAPTGRGRRDRSSSPSARCNGTIKDVVDEMRDAA